MKIEFRTGCITPSRMGSQELKKVSQLIADGNKSVLKCAEEFGLEVSTFWENYHQLKDDINVVDREKIDQILELEPKVLAHLVLLISEHARKFHRAGRLDFNDLLQEGCMWVGYCLFLYNGSTELTTYIGTSIYKHFQKMAKSCRNVSTVSDVVFQRSRRVRNMMLREQKTFDECVEELKLSKTQIKNIQRALAEVNVPDEEEFNLGEIEAKEIDLFPPEGDYQVWMAVEEADLTEFEYAVMMHHVHGSGGLEKVAKQFTNPRTGKVFTRAWASQALQSAIKKVRKVYLSRQAA